MIERILPAGVVSVDTTEDPVDAVLFPEEEELIRRAVDRRRREFRTVRHCARRALDELGVAAAALLPGERGAPRWPPGVVGSMTHCDRYRAAAVARHAEVLTLGIDAEPHEPLPDGVLGYVSLAEERAELAELSAADGRIRWDRVLFCVKETIYKAWFPLTGSWLGFEDASVTITAAGTVDRCDGVFSARVLAEHPVAAPGAPSGFDGRWVVAEGLVLAAIAVPAAGESAAGAHRATPGGRR